MSFSRKKELVNVNVVERTIERIVNNPKIVDVPYEVKTPKLDELERKLDKISTLIDKLGDVDKLIASLEKLNNVIHNIKVVDETVKTQHVEVDYIKKKVEVPEYVKVSKPEYVLVPEQVRYEVPQYETKDYVIPRVREELQIIEKQVEVITADIKNVPVNNAIIHNVHVDAIHPRYLCRKCGIEEVHP